MTSIVSIVTIDEMLLLYLLTWEMDQPQHDHWTVVPAGDKYIHTNISTTMSSYTWIGHWLPSALIRVFMRLIALLYIVLVVVVVVVVVAARGDLQVLATKTVTFGPVALLRVPPNSGTAYHCHSAIRHWHLDNSAAGWKLICLV